jgi:hypothetical protein
VLYWQDTPDEVFQTIVREAIEYYLDHFHVAELGEEDFREMHPWLSRCFTAEEAMTQLRALLSAHGTDGTLFQITDYHWLLLWTVLEWFCQIHNDLAVEDSASEKVGPYRIREIDFDYIRDTYFWDEDFLIPDLFNAPADVRHQMMMNPEAWGISAGLKPHPDELAIRVFEPRGATSDPPRPTAPRPWRGGKRLRRYPPKRWPKGMEEAEE